MINPWLQIPATDYEARMSLPEVAQAPALSKLMASALTACTPSSLLVIGCTTGNGFEHIDTTHIRRVVGVDINPAYLEIQKAGLPERFPAWNWSKPISLPWTSLSNLFRWCSLVLCSSIWMSPARCAVSLDVWFPLRFLWRFSNCRAPNPRH